MEAQRGVQKSVDRLARSFGRCAGRLLYWPSFITCRKMFYGTSPVPLIIYISAMARELLWMVDVPAACIAAYSVPGVWEGEN